MLWIVRRYTRVYFIHRIHTVVNSLQTEGLGWLLNGSFKKYAYPCVYVYDGGLKINAFISSKTYENKNKRIA